jgi:COMPASS component SWD1
MVARHRIAGAGTIRSLTFAVTGRRTRLVTNSSDRTVRLINLPPAYPKPPSDSAEDAGEHVFIQDELEPSYRFNDAISRTPWAQVSVDGMGMLLAGGAADPASHKIFLWDIANDGRLLTALDGGREPLVDVHVRFRVENSMIGN